MASIPVVIKHAGNKHNLDLDLGSTGETFKYQVFSVTGVEPERQKIIVKGGQLKNEQDMSKLGIKPNATLMMMGTPAGGAGSIMKPKQETKFVEDMSEAEIAKSEGATPAGLQNMGNTCYMNSTLQTLRAIPELQQELQTYTSGENARQPGQVDLSQFGLSGLGSSTDLTASLRDLYKQMGETQTGFPPIMFLESFRRKYPQFAEKTRDGRTYAQQDAEEAWSQLVTTLKGSLHASSPSGSAQAQTGPSAAAANPETKSFIDDYLGGVFHKIEHCNDAAATEAEPPQEKAPETFFKLNCHVSSAEVKHLREGVAAALSDTYTKTSPTLSREAEYTTTSRIARLPKYMPVHFVRFYWKRDINKKAKIMKKVTFPMELDALEYCTDHLRAQLVPVRDKVRELRKEILDVERARKRQKRMDPADEPGSSSKAKEQPKTSDGKGDKNGKKTADGDTEMGDGETYKTDAQIEAERAASILAAKKALLASVPAAVLADRGANPTGLYELRGLVTHQGASADSGHYTAYVKKTGTRDPTTGELGEEDGKWWWFNDEKVSEVDEEKIETLSGGGESHSALILLYRAVELPQLTKAEKEQSS